MEFQKKPNIVILGAGISGLALAWFLKNRIGPNINLTILEQNNQLGGAIKTLQKEGFVFELGPHSCRAQNHNLATQQLMQELGLQADLLNPNPSACKRYLYTQKKFQLVPQNLFSWAFSPWLGTCLSAIWRDWHAPPGVYKDESIESFCQRRFGDRMTKQLIDPLVLGIYGGKMQELSMRSCFPHLFQAEQKRGSVIKSWLFDPQNKAKDKRKKPFFSFTKGMGFLIETLQKQLHSHIQMNRKIIQLHHANPHYEIECEDEKSFQADLLFSALPASSLASLLLDKHGKLIALLNSIQQSTLTVVNLGFRKNYLKQKGFGYLIPSTEQQKTMGVIWSSCIFPQQNTSTEEVRLTAMLNGHYSDEEGLTIALRELSQQMGQSLFPDVWHVSRTFIPKYMIGHQAKLDEIESLIKTELPNFFLLGNSFYGVSIPDCIQHAKNIADQLGRCSVD